MSRCVQCGAELPEGARFCPSCGSSVEARVEADERKLATVLFADLVGSTALGSGQDPERTRALLDRFYDAMAAEVTTAGGTIEKFAGDAIMASFGAPAAMEDHAERALHAALAMQRRLADVFEGELSMRIGVNTGEVVVGRPREGSSFVSGDAVNVAARLEHAAGPAEILAGERTVAAARGAFEFGQSMTVEAKGKAGGIICSRLLRAISLMRPRGVAGLAHAFVGRDSELDLLQATYRRVAVGGEPHVVTILGESGVGKTTLVRHLWEWLAAQDPAPLRRTGRCLPYGHGITYWPLGEILKEHLGIDETERPEDVRAKLGTRQALGLTLGLDPPDELHPLTAREQLRDAWIDFLQELVHERPAAVLVEDLHWAEDELLDVLERLVAEVHGPLMVLGTARPEVLDRRPAWGGGRRNASLLWLEPLGAEEAERMLGELLSSELPAPIRSRLVAHAEGNPFFVEELVATLIDRDLLRRRNGAWVLDEVPDDFDVPDSVQAVIAARIDLLPAAEKTALQAAALVGRVFWEAPVRELIGAEADFGLLEDRDFVRRRAGSSIPGDREWAIKHALTREVAYASLPKARRARLHAAFADWLERTGGREEHAPLLAHHYAEAVRPEDADLAWGDASADLGRHRERALYWLERAAELAVARYEIDEGLELLHRALPLQDDADRRAALWRAIGRANALKFDGEAFWTAMQRSLEVCSDRATCADAYGDLAFETVGRAGMWKAVPDPELVGGWIERALELSEPDSRARAKALLARAFLVRTPEIAREASAVAERTGDAELRSHAFEARRLAASVAGDHEQALTWAQRRFDMIDELHDPDLVADVYANAMPTCVALGRFREARRLADRHDEVTSGLTAHHRMHGVAILLELEALAGGWERARSLQQRMEQAVEANAATPCIRNATSAFLCSVAHAYAGNETESRRLERLAEEVGYEAWQLPDVPRLRLALVRDELDLARGLLESIREPEGQSWFGLIFRTTLLDALVALGERARVEEEAAPLLRPRTYLEPFALRALGMVREDAESIRLALERFEAMRLDWHAAETRKLLAG